MKRELYYGAPGRPSAVTTDEAGPWPEACSGPIFPCVTLDPVRKKRLRIGGLLVALAGSSVGVAAVCRFLMSVARNDVAGGRPLTRIPEYYIQIGAHYARGFTTGFFLCYFLMLFAVIAGSWVDEILKRRRSERAPGRSLPAPE